MKRIALFVAVVIVGAYFFNSYMESKARHETNRAKTKQIQTAISQMASRTDAVRDWETDLSKGEGYRLEPILTVELERLWLQQRPVLFIGSIKDIATYGQYQYVVLVKKSLFYGSLYMFGTELQLSLVSDKNMIDSFLKEHPDIFKYSDFKNGVAVVAHINSIKTSYISRGEVGVNEIKSGEGELLEIMYTGDVRLRTGRKPTSD